MERPYCVVAFAKAVTQVQGIVAVVSHETINRLLLLSARVAETSLQSDQTRSFLSQRSGAPPERLGDSAFERSLALEAVLR